MFKKILLIGLLAVMTGCASGVQKVTQYDDRSVVYTWVNIDGISGNTFTGAWMKQYKPKIDPPFYSMGTKEFKNGYIIYQFGLPQGSFKLDELRLRSCIGPICGDGSYRYTFHQSDFGSVRVEKLGVYSLGKVDMIYNSGQFDVVPSKNAPSDKEILEALLTVAPKNHPVISDRINQTLVTMK